MTTLNGFLHQKGPGSEPRLTKGQKELVLRAATTALQTYAAHQPPAVRDGLKVYDVFLTEALELFPDDRSCFSCDFKRSDYCGHWQEDIPPAAMEAGCDRWQDNGAPF